MEALPDREQFGVLVRGEACTIFELDDGASILIPGLLDGDGTTVAAVAASWHLAPIHLVHVIGMTWRGW
jgi:hypothetical protein